MNGEQRTVFDVVDIYRTRLLDQVQHQSSSDLGCSDQDLCVHVKALLSDDPQGVHRLGVDPLRVMEEALLEAPSARLQTLEKAFQVLEQAALNLYISPWRAEYKVVKMYSGVFTHVVKPTLSDAHIRSLFGLLGYQVSPARPEQLQLYRAGSPEELLRLSCAFFLARCECRLLLETLGSHSQDTAWQLGVVKERRRGRSPQVCLDLTRSDLMPTTFADQSAVSQVCVSSLSCRLSGLHVSPEPVPAGVSGAAGEGPAGLLDCSCLQQSLYVRRCVVCDQRHDASCAVLDHCRSQSHFIDSSESLTDLLDPTLLPSPDSCPSALSSLTPLSDHPPFTFHGCCDVIRPDPYYLCTSCGVFHSRTCSDVRVCRVGHDIRALGCKCGKTCLRAPLVLCRYCGNEYCRTCWYKSPLTCDCGRPLDPSTSV